MAQAVCLPADPRKRNRNRKKKLAIHLDDAVDTHEFAQYDGFTVQRELTG
jgi:hypothetical protein